MFAGEPAVNYGNFVYMHVHVSFFSFVYFSFLYFGSECMFLFRKLFTNTDAHAKRTHKSEDAQNTTEQIVKFHRCISRKKSFLFYV